MQQGFDTRLTLLLFHQRCDISRLLRDLRSALDRLRRPPVSIPRRNSPRATRQKDQRKRIKTKAANNLQCVMALRLNYLTGCGHTQPSIHEISNHILDFHRPIEYPSLSRQYQMIVAEWTTISRHCTTFPNMDSKFSLVHGQGVVILHNITEHRTQDLLLTSRILFRGVNIQLHYWSIQLYLS